MKVYMVVAELNLGLAGFVRVPLQLFGAEADAQGACDQGTARLNELQSRELCSKSPVGPVSDGVPALLLLASLGIQKFRLAVVKGETASPIVEPQVRIHMP